VLSPIDAIKGLVRWVAISLPVAARISDLNLLASLPALIEPFACVSPLVDAMVRNARATRWFRCEGRWQEARQLWSDVLRDLESSSGIDTTYLTRVRTAIHFALGATDALLGIPSDRADRLEKGEHDPMQLAQIYYVRKMAALSQGDWEAAERHRRHAETLRLRTKMYQSISTLLMELVVHAAARDLTGLRQVRSGIHAMADRYPGWQPIKHFADAHYARLCGDLAEAMCAIDRAIEDGATRFPGMEMLSAARVLKIELFVELDQTEQAVALARPTLARYRANGVHQAAREIERALALADAKLGHFEAAMAGIEGVIDEQLRVGVSGTQLGLSYETATRIAIWARDVNAFEKYLALTAQRYRPGFSSVLGALYERLQDEARTAGLSDTSPEPFDYAVTPSASGDSAWFTHRVVAAMAGRDTWQQRAGAALQLLCDERKLRGGHLFLLTERGLELAASNIELADIDEAQSFVQGFLTAEISAARGEDIKTQTLFNVVAVDTSAMRTEWTAVDGTAFTAIPVSGVVEGRWCIVGVALFRELTQTSASLAGLVSAIAACFARDGDAKGAVFV
jgi:tetratricopeptide (TPR) repeat protein